MLGGKNIFFFLKESQAFQPFTVVSLVCFFFVGDKNGIPVTGGVCTLLKGSFFWDGAGCAMLIPIRCIAAQPGHKKTYTQSVHV